MPSRRTPKDTLLLRIWQRSGLAERTSDAADDLADALRRLRPNYVPFDQIELERIHALRCGRVPVDVAVSPERDPILTIAIKKVADRFKAAKARFAALRKRSDER